MSLYTVPGTAAVDSNGPALEFSSRFLTDFLSAMSYDYRKPAKSPNLELENATMRVLSTEITQPEHLRPLLCMVPTFCAFADMVYPENPFEVKLYIVIYTLLLTYIDDQASSPETQLDLQAFAVNISRGRMDKYATPAVGYLARLVGNNTSRHFGPYLTGVIVKTTIDFTLGCLLEMRYPSGFPIPLTCTRFPRFQRSKSGASEAFSIFLFPESLFPEADYLSHYLPALPDMIDLLDHINDVLSFYKESVIGSEENTYIVNVARIEGCDPMLVLQHTCSQMVECRKNFLNVLLTADGRLQRVSERFVDGYIMWHVTQERYRLGEIGIQVGSAPVCSSWE